ncbi:hypothetical protein ACIA5D_27140 [Actinoplanes sp. NPDC051513]|uniref:hypothetical protein n=1 Tax=Actinoplanes sp. NPDC051513 TaxID=3363908 RepID=UPI00379322BE
MTVADGPDKEPADVVALVDPVFAVPGVDVGLSDGAGRDARLVQPGEERLGLGELMGDVLLGGGSQGSAGRVGADAGEVVPQRELAQDLFVRVVSNGSEPAA